MSITIDDTRLKSNLYTKQTFFFSEKLFIYTILGFTQSTFYPLNNIDGIYQLIAGSYKSNKPINITGIDKIHMKCDYFNGSLVNSTREPILHSFVLSSTQGHKKFKEP